VEIRGRDLLSQCCKAGVPFAPESQSRLCCAGIKRETMKMSKDDRGPVSERDNIAAHVANFKATQEKFQREREAHFDATLKKARPDHPSSSKIGH
jgi:hypothetical protein